MRSTSLISDIRTLLFLMAEEIQDANSSALPNDAFQAESFFCELLNMIFGWELAKAKINQDGFDLFDAKNHLHVQVTTTLSHQLKYKKVIKFLEKHASSKKYCTFILLFVSKRVDTGILKIRSVNETNYEGFDIPRLIKEIIDKKKTALKLQPIYDILKAEMGYDNSTTTRSIAEPKQKISPLNKDKFYVHRADLITDLYTFTQKDNGLITGGPGFGKSFIIEELQRLYNQHKIPCFIIRINELIQGSKEELATELGTISDWLQSLEKVVVSNKHRNLLIFDAFDTAKEENVRLAILKHIKTAIDTLKDGWNICVSTRTYDAQKSQKLIDLFPQANLTREITCRYIEIDELTDREIEITLLKSNRLNQAHGRCNPSLKKLLHIPYFFRLFDQLIQGTGKLPFSVISTEEQLLALYWKRFVNKSEKELLLNQLTKELGRRELLSCNKFDVLNKDNTEVYESLLSDGVLSETSYTRQNIGFSHNILLEYALYVYVLPPSPNEMISFIRINKRHPFIFRNSYIYFYSNLWGHSRELFWEHYFKIKDENSSVFRLFYQTILNYIFSSSFSSIADFQPVQNIIDPDERSMTTKKILESIRFIRPEDLTKQDVALIELASKDLHQFVIWDLGNLIEHAIKRFANVPVQLNKLAVACSRYLDYVIISRNNPEIKLNVENNGFHWGINNYCKTLTYQKQYKRPIKKILEILKEEDFPINFFYHLANNINYIAAKDIDFALQVYTAIYETNENSKKQTSLGNNVVMPLSSNRKQDFNGVHHELERRYKQLLCTNPAASIAAGLRIVDAILLNKHTYWKERETFPIELLDIQTTMVYDHSVYDYNIEKDYGTLAHIKNIFAYFHQLIEDGKKEEILNLLKIYIANAKSTILWVRLTRFLEKRIDIFHETAFELLNSVGIYCSDYTLYNAGELLKAGWSHFNAFQKENIERTILARPLTGYQDENDLAKIKVQVLSCIPEGEALLEQSKQLLNQHGRVVNKPPYDYSISHGYSARPEELMIRAGVSTDVPQEVTAYNLIIKLSEFNEPHLYANKAKKVKPPYPPYVPIAEELIELKNRSGFNATLNINCDDEISKFFNVISYKVNKGEKALIKLMEETALQYIDDPAYLTVSEDGDLKNESTFFSASPRTFSTSVIINLMILKKSDRLKNKLVELISDPTQNVRLKAIRGSLIYIWHADHEIFWPIVHARLKIETDALCYQGLLTSFNYDNILSADLELAEEAVGFASQKIRENETNDDLDHIYVSLLLRLFIKFKSEKAQKLLYENMHVKSICRQILIECFEIIDPHNKASEFRAIYFPEVSTLLKDLLALTFSSVETKSLKDPTVNDELETIDFFIQQMYFSITNGRGENRGNLIDTNKKIAYYKKIRLLITQIIDSSKNLQQGFMVAHSGYYMMQLLNFVLPFEPSYVLSLANDTVSCAASNNFTYDYTTMTETIKLTERVFADYRSILNKDDNFNKMLTILDHFSGSGWMEALNLTWKLKDIF
ncbi:SMEK domain-containing protein [Mucilaginibacter sp. L196]|uniref:SMEK domain-containing protein n=1 Tax=Mucilaginibacter sp. L196 TaxID=1641870 RepID=UPI002110ADDC|nr:SMEK domain-containing protein [Mucilaginibacter sp. L196]